MKNTMRARRARAMKLPHRFGIGSRCKDYGGGCMTCACWHFLDTFGKFPPFYLDASRYQDALIDAIGWEDRTWEEARKLTVPMPEPVPESYGDTYDEDADAKLAAAMAEETTTAAGRTPVITG